MYVWVVSPLGHAVCAGHRPTPLLLVPPWLPPQTLRRTDAFPSRHIKMLVPAWSPSGRCALASALSPIASMTRSSTDPDIATLPATCWPGSSVTRPPGRATTATGGVFGSTSSPACEHDHLADERVSPNVIDDAVVGVRLRRRCRWRRRGRPHGGGVRSQEGDDPRPHVRVVTPEFGRQLRRGDLRGLLHPQHPPSADPAPGASCRALQPPARHRPQHRRASQGPARDVGGTEAGRLRLVVTVPATTVGPSRPTALGADESSG
jgi:hypothetical protein